MNEQKLGISKEDLQDILKTVIEETRRPDPKVQAKMRRDEELIERGRKMRLDSLVAQQKSRETAQARCPHRKNNGHPEAETAIHHPPMSSDGFIHPICVECGAEGGTTPDERFKPYRPAMMEMSGMVQ